MEVDSVFVTGANRGIGLELVRQLVHLPKPPRYVFASYRDKSSVQDLKDLRDATKGTKIVMIKMDVTALEEVQAAKKIIEDMVGEGLTLLINNAGAVKLQGFPNITEENLLYHFTTNTVAPIRVLQEFLPLLQKAANRSNAGSGKSVSRGAVLNISSAAGCITRSGLNAIHKSPSHGYAISKAALNMAMRKISADVDAQGILVVMMCPGWVKTELGGKGADLEVDESVTAILKTLSTLNESHQGAFLSRDGNAYEF